MKSNTGICKACNQQILWAHTGRSKMPLDLHPNSEGNVLVWSGDREHLRIVAEPVGGARLQANVLTAAEAATARKDGLPLFMAHFRSCPKGDEMRRK